MNIKKENIGDLHEIITIELAPEDYQNQVMKSLKNLKQTIEIPGFRKKMIPIEIIDKRHGESIRGEEISKLAEAKITEYIHENELSLIFNPIYCKEKSVADFTKNGNFSFSYEVGIRPEIKINYDDLKDIIYYKVIVSEEDIDERIMYLRKQIGKFSSTETVAENDILLVNVSYIDEDRTFISNLQINNVKEEELSLFLGKHLHEEMDIDTAKVFKTNADRSAFLKLKIEEVEKIEAAPTNVRIRIEAIHHIDPADIDTHFFEYFFPDGSVTTEAGLREYLKEQIELQFKFETDMLYRTVIMEKLINNISPIMVLPDVFVKRYFSTVTQQDKEPSAVAEIEENYDELRKSLVHKLITEQMIADLEISVYYEEISSYIENAVRQKYLGSAILPDEVIEEQIQKYTVELLKEKDNINNTINSIISYKLEQALKGKLNPEIKELFCSELLNELKKKDNPEIEDKK
jgi:trigger factor